MANYWKRMSSGRYIDMGNFTQDDVDIGDIEASLNYTFRFNGHHKDRRPLTVAQHSLLCLNLSKMYAPEDYDLHLGCFIHDFAEAYIGDVSTPVKRVMGQAWKDFAEPIEQCVWSVSSTFDLSLDLKDQIKLFDLMSLDIERRSLWNSQMGKDKWPNVIGGPNLQEKQQMFESVQEVEWVYIQDIWKELYDLTLQTKKPKQ